MNIKLIQNEYKMNRYKSNIDSIKSNKLVSVPILNSIQLFYNCIFFNRFSVR